MSLAPFGGMGMPAGHQAGDVQLSQVLKENGGFRRRFQGSEKLHPAAGKVFVLDVYQ
ncbi:MAG: hypothetical protein P4L43_08890 [Syntrophobacteraceae bacterium]|nr:hypothetical protein [Syntrophobacteraceae bacterium]